MSFFSSLMNEITGKTRPFTIPIDFYGVIYTVVEVISKDDGDDSWWRFSMGDKCVISKGDMASAHPLIRDTLFNRDSPVALFNLSKSAKSFNPQFYTFYTKHCGLQIESNLRNEPSANIYYIDIRLTPSGVSILEDEIEVVCSIKLIFSFHSDKTIIIKDEYGDHGIILKPFKSI